MPPTPQGHASGVHTRIDAVLHASFAVAPRGHVTIFNPQTLAIVSRHDWSWGALPWPSAVPPDDARRLPDLFAPGVHTDLEAAIARAHSTSMTRAALVDRDGGAVMVTIATFDPDARRALAVIEPSAVELEEPETGPRLNTRIVCDRDGHVVSVDGALGSWVHRDSSIGRWAEHIVTPASRPDLHAAVAAVRAGDPYARARVCAAAAGLPFEVVVAARSPHLVIDFYDESTERQAAGALDRLQTQFAKLSETLPVGVFVVGRNGRLEFHSRRMREMCGPTIAREQGWTEFVHPDDRHLLQRALSELSPERGFNLELRCIRADGSTGIFRLAGTELRDDDGHLLSLVGFAEDITEQRELYRRIEFQASFDDLTELPNRPAVLEQLRVALADEVPGSRTGVLFIGLDGFKLINDTQGHSVGDIVLTEVALRFRRAVRPNDVIGRLGGDEFVVVAPGISGAEEATRLAQRLHDILSTPVLADGRIISVSASIGITTSGEVPASSEQLVGDADIAMYEAKRSGRNRSVVFDAPLRSRAAQRFDMTADLRHARRRRELRLEYQPIIDLATNRLVGAEGLVRWEHPAMGRIGPDVFIPLAEEIGLITDIGEWVVEQACADIDRLRCRGLIDDSFVVSVNASAHQFDNVASLATSCLAALDQYGLNPRNLRFELTESVPITAIPQAADRIRQLTSYGFGLAIDDFGTGYSSLGYLTMLPFDVLKLDLSLIAQIDFGSAAMAVVDSLTRMSHEMGFMIVAEGIENGRQQKLLRDAGVQYGQGFHISRPVSLAGLMDLLDLGVATRV